MFKPKVYCIKCDRLIENPHGNQHYHKDCYYVQKKERSIRQFEALSLKADHLWRNERILRGLYYEYGAQHELDPDYLESLGYDFELYSVEKKLDGRIIICMRQFGYQFLKNKKLLICKI